MALTNDELQAKIAECEKRIQDIIAEANRLVAMEQGKIEAYREVLNGTQKDENS